MTSTLSAPPQSRGKDARRKGRSDAVGGGLPQVNLLPPEVRAARGLKVVKRWLLISIGLLVLVIAGVFVWSVMERSVAQESLAQAQAETARLQDEEQQYAEVPLVLGALDSTTAARELGMSTEVSWKPYLDAITAVLPADVSIESIGLSSATPMAPAAPPASPLEAPSLAQLTFTGQTSTVPDAAALIDALNSVPGLADAWLVSAAVEGIDGTTYYLITGTVQVSDAARAQRFASTEGE
ncbi:fimbrial assembly protein [Actinotalea ferrariae CF5-4]|uniref:Fimbrial assembly protein n=1 Tax=Actinotalea ferrariae CF5-4 TaxID=948458 RepID=A0A021VZE1_9CELL|nr:hypothetical protein [Actinotalea ferrariae]EYR64432.1 fimbrial assembly protein [Actinotalea ferrariae CF5-4]